MNAGSEKAGRVDYYALATAGVQKLQPYVPGKPVDELERELGIKNIVKLASNENPLGPSPKVLEAIQRALPELTRYPDGNGFALKQKLSQRFNLRPEQITLGNGSNDILEIIARAFADSQSEIIFSQHAFAVYPIAAQAIGARAVVTPARDFGHDLDAMVRAVTEHTKLIFLANPNNPTGTWFDAQALERFLQAVPERVLVVLDEAYVEYVEQEGFPDGLSYLPRYPNLIVSRTFSKAYGLAALRVGYAVSNPQVADILNRVRQPFNVDSLAQVAAVAALDDEEYVRRTVDMNRQGMAQICDGLRDLGLSWVPSLGNFLCVNLGRDAMPIYQALLRKGVIVRPVANYEMPQFLRISVGTQAENAVFLRALAEVLGES